MQADRRSPLLDWCRLNWRWRRCAAPIALGVMLLAAALPAAAQTQDTTPSGMVAFFTAPDPTTGACPAGWFVPPQAQGRLMVGLGNTGVVGNTVGTAMTNATDPTHAHSYAPSITLADRHVSGASGGSNHNGAHNGTHTLSPPVMTNPSPSNLPFIQLIVCQKQ